MAVFFERAKSADEIFAETMSPMKDAAEVRQVIGGYGTDVLEDVLLHLRKRKKLVAEITAFVLKNSVSSSELQSAVEASLHEDAEIDH